MGSLRWSRLHLAVYPKIGQGWQQDAGIRFVPESRDPGSEEKILRARTRFMSIRLPAFTFAIEYLPEELRRAR
jgi:hypothetical protein